jgi:hypothetical protein
LRHHHSLHHFEIALQEQHQHQPLLLLLLLLDCLGCQVRQRHALLLLPCVSWILRRRRVSLVLPPLLLLHWPAAAPLQPSWQLSDLQKQGKAGNINH